MLSLRETARRHDIDPGYLSTRVRARKPAKGYELHQYACFDEDGNIEGFEFPNGYDFPHGSEEGEDALVEPRAESKASPPIRNDPSSGAWCSIDAVNQVLKKADRFPLPERDDWLDMDGVAELWSRHLPDPEDYDEERRQVKAIWRALKVLKTEGAYRRDRVIRYFKLAAQYGSAEATRRLVKAQTIGAEAAPADRPIHVHEWLAEDEAYKLIVSQASDVPVSRLYVTTAMRTFLQPAHTPDWSRVFFRRDRIWHFVDLINRRGYMEALVELEERSKHAQRT